VQVIRIAYPSPPSYHRCVGVGQADIFTLSRDATTEDTVQRRNRDLCRFRKTAPIMAIPWPQGNDYPI
ncbi:MAG: hypothetical protein N2B57_06730, partial [Planctomycetales bacterium]